MWVYSKFILSYSFSLPLFWFTTSSFLVWIYCISLLWGPSHPLLPDQLLSCLKFLVSSKPLYDIHRLLVIWPLASFPVINSTAINNWRYNSTICWLLLLVLSQVPSIISVLLQVIFFFLNKPICYTQFHYDIVKYRFLFTLLGFFGFIWGLASFNNSEKFSAIYHFKFVFPYSSLIWCILDLLILHAFFPNWSIMKRYSLNVQ